jgi:hypothetical protein
MIMDKISREDLVPYRCYKEYNEGEYIRSFMYLERSTGSENYAHSERKYNTTLTMFKVLLLDGVDEACIDLIDPVIIRDDIFEYGDAMEFYETYDGAEYLDNFEDGYYIEFKLDKDQQKYYKKLSKLLRI